MKHLAVINRKCFNRKSKRQRSDLIKYLTGTLKADIKFSEHPDHAYQILKDGNEYDVIVSVGGDGTIHEIVNSIDLEKQSVMIMPIGGGNTLAHELNITNESIKKPDTFKNIKIDLMKCTFTSNNEEKTKYAFSTTGVGLFAKACAMTNEKLKFLGPLGYFIAGIIYLFSNKPFHAAICIDDYPTEKKILNHVFINNTKNVASFLYFPDAELDDGVFDGVVTYANNFKMFIFMLGTSPGKIFYRPFSYKKMKKIDLIFDEPKALMLDGEIYPNVSKINYSICKQKLKIQLK